MTTEQTYVVRMTNKKDGQSEIGYVTAASDSEADKLAYELAAEWAVEIFDWRLYAEDEPVRIALTWTETWDDVEEYGGTVTVHLGDLDHEDTYTVEYEDYR